MVIRVIETKTYEYKPDWSSSYYKDRQADTLEKVIQADMEYAKIYGLDSMEDEDPTETIRLWQIIDEEGNIIHEVRQV